MKNNLTITDFCKLSLKQQKEYIISFCKHLNDLKSQMYDLEYKIEFDPFINDFIEEKIQIENHINDLKNEINNITEKIEVIKKIINKWILINNPHSR